MPTIRLVASTYYLSSTTYLSLSDESNMYTNTDSTTFATVENIVKGTTTCYLYIRGFNFNAVPANATVTSFTVKLKAYHTGGNTSTSYAPKLCHNTAQLIGNCSSQLQTSVQTYTFTGLSDTFSDLVEYGSDFGIRINCRRAKNNVTAYFYIYGAEIEVNYTIPEILYLKVNGEYKACNKIYKKINNVWTEVTLDSLTEPGVYIKK